ncbi:hypothetical protein RYX36_004895 [Vicia faba]
MTGATKPYLKKLRHYAGDVPLLTSNYVSSKRCVVVNVNPKLDPEFAICIVLSQISYFEFIPLPQLDGNWLELEPLGLTGVKIGEEYVVVFTNHAGAKFFNNLFFYYILE